MLSLMAYDAARSAVAVILNSAKHNLHECAKSIGEVRRLPEACNKTEAERVIKV